MATAKQLAYFSTTLTQGGADAFVQASVTTGLSGQTKSAFKVREILIEYGATGVTQGVPAVSANIEIVMTRKTQTAMVNVTDKSVILKFGRTSAFTTSGMAVLPKVDRFLYSADDNIIIVEDPIYFALDSAATGATNIVEIRVGYELTTISEVDRLTLIANSLA